jgi:hypothetical protein
MNSDNYLVRKQIHTSILAECGRKVIAIAMLLLAAVSVSLAQTGATGTIIGTVTDASGATVPNAKVTIVNAATNVTRETTTSSTGTYAVPFLIPGVYNVTVGSAGFSSQVVSGVTLAVGKELAVDLRLKPGSVTESVNVTGTAVMLDTANAATGTVISEAQVQDLPLNGRNFTQLLLLGAGAVQSSGEQGSFRKNEGDSINIQGAHPGSNRFMLDGIAINDVYYQTPAIIPSIDALEEFQEQTKGYSAAYGFGANQINLSTKSGTNAIHGTAYDFLRNDALDAKSYFDDPNAKIPPLRQNQFGFTVGGPVWIPKIYNGKNKTFFFVNYEGLRANTSTTRFGIVPTPAQLSGVFTNTIINPNTGTPYPNNTIPESDFSTFGKSAISHFPAPNGDFDGNNYRYTAANITKANQQNYRVDHTFSPKDTVFGRYTQTSYEVSSPAITAEGNTFQKQPTRQVAVSYTHTFSPSVLNQFRFGWTKEKVDILGTATSQDEFNSTGLGGTFPYDSTYTMFPSIGLRGMDTVGGPTYTPNLFHQPSWQFSDTLSFVKGAHNISTGIDIIRVENYVNTTIQPTLGFDGFWTGFGVVDGAGDPVADLLLGLASSAQASVPTDYAKSITDANSNDFYHLQVGPWVQDDWKVNSRLTVNLGLRWDFSPRPTDIRGNQSWVDPTRPGGGLCLASKKIIDQGLGDDLLRYCGNSPGETPWKVFAPRVGIAFRPTNSDNTSIRASFGIFYDSFEAKEGFTGSAWPFSLSPTFQHTPVANLFPVAPPAQPVTSADLSFSFIQNPIHPPYMEMWTVSVQHMLPRGIKLEAAYLGSAGHHLVGRTWANAPTQYDPATGGDPTDVSGRIPYPNLGLILDHPYVFNSNYNALNLQAEHRGKNLTLLAGYTWSHSLDVRSGATGINNELSGNGPMNQYDFNADYGNSAFDATHHFVGSFVYNLPLGRGQFIAGNVNRARDLLIGGWQVNGIVTFQTGFPFSIAADDLQFANQGFAQRADIVGDPYPSGFHKSRTQWFNTAAYVNPGLGAYGNSRRNSLRAPGISNLDFSLFKNIQLAESVRLQPRLEAFNLLNHPQFGTPSSYVNGTSFGVINSAGPGRIVQVAMKLIW